MLTTDHKPRWNFTQTVFGVTAISVVCFLCNSVAHSADNGSNLEQLLSLGERSVVKIFGAGGVKGLENYQSGIIIDDGKLVITSWSTVLDVEKVRVVTFDGRQLDANIVGVDPQCELALLSIGDTGLRGFELKAGVEAKIGQRVFAISNLYKIATGNEACSSQKGVVMAIAPLTKRRAGVSSLYQGRVYMLDVMTNNPGATGGALIDLSGRLTGMIGKELRDDQAGIWVNYALPVDVIRNSVDRILTGQTNNATANSLAVSKPHKMSELGIALIPDVLPKTPAYVDGIRSDSVAARAGLQSNDLILLLNDQRVDSRKSFERLLSMIDRGDSFQLMVQRGQELIRIQVRP